MRINPARIVLLGLLGLCVLVAILLITVSRMRLTGIQYEIKPFTREDWFMRRETRYEYAPTLINNRVLIGKTPDEITRLLGEPDYECGPDCLEYFLGYTTNGFVPDVMEITLAHGKVTKVSQHRR